MKNEVKPSEVCRYLKTNHSGKEKAVLSRELERLFSVGGRSLRRIISSLRQDGYPICSSSNGYYYAKSQDEVNDTVSRLNEFVTGVSNTRTGLLYARVPSFPPALEITIRIGGTGE